MKADRSIRRFDASVPVNRDELTEIVGLVRYCASGRNLQPLRYRIVTERDETEAVFPLLKWAGYLADWDGPTEAERPAAYVIQCLDTSLTSDPMADPGLQMQAITLGATACGLGCCIIKAFNAQRLAETLSLPEDMKPLHVIAVGHPVEQVVIEPMEADGNIRYWRTPDGVHHVPKRSLGDILI